jgi:hypothetical protein
MHILVELDGVLRGHRNDEPISQGIITVAQLAAYNQISLMTELTAAEATQWINMNKVVDFDNLLDASMGLVDEELAHRQIKAARAKGNVDLFITANPNNWVYAFDLGIPTLMFGLPAYSRPEFRPDAPKKVRAWSQIEEAVKKQNELRTKDARLSRSDGVRFE